MVYLRILKDLHGKSLNGRNQVKDIENGKNLFLCKQVRVIKY